MLCTTSNGMEKFEQNGPQKLETEQEKKIRRVAALKAELFSGAQGNPLESLAEEAESKSWKGGPQKDKERPDYLGSKMRKMTAIKKELEQIFEENSENLLSVDLEGAKRAIKNLYLKKHPELN